MVLVSRFPPGILQKLHPRLLDPEGKKSTVSRGMYQRQSEKPQPTCGYCGRTLDTGFNYVCHVCGASYCYAHKPDRCDHRKGKPTPISVVTRSKA